MLYETKIWKRLRALGGFPGAGAGRAGGPPRGPRRRKPRVGDESGVVIVIAAIMMVVVIGFAALVVDIGMVSTAHCELQNAMDAAALAGAAKLLERDYDQARQLAVDYAARNTVLGQPLTLDPTTGVIFGVYDMETKTFTPLDELPPGTEPNSMRIHADYSVPLLLAPVLGMQHADLGQTAMSVASQAIRFAMLVLDKSGSMGFDTPSFRTTTSGVDIQAGTYGLTKPPSSRYMWYHSVLGQINIPRGSKFWTGDRNYVDGAYLRLPAGRLYYLRYRRGRWRPKRKTVWGVAQPMTDVQAAAVHFVNQLNFNFDKCGLVTFSTSASLDKTLSQDKNAIIDAIWSFVPERSTNIGQGLEYAVDELDTSRAQGFGRKIIILLSDGETNVGGHGMSPDDYALWAAEQARQQGTLVYTVSLGTHADDALMRHIANVTGAKFYKAQHGGDLPVIFEEISHSIPPQLTM